MRKRFIIVCVIFMFVSNIQAQTASDTAINYVHHSSPSFEVRLLKFAARMFLPKNSLLKKLGRDHYVSKAAPIPKQLFSEFTIDITQVCGRNVYAISPKGKKSGKYVLFLHGGGYINNIFHQHWKFIAQIIRETNCTFIVPDYPLAPAANYKDAFTMLDAIYSAILSKTSASDIILMGDSAGGGLALALAEKQKKESLPQANQIILLAPWLDVRMTNPEIKEIEQQDVTLRVDNLVVAGKAWAGTSSTDNYLISPINGSLEGLSRISIFIGTHDILLADCRKLKSLLKQKGIPMNYFEYPKMFHDWMMLVSLKESKCAIAQIGALILE